MLFNIIGQMVIGWLLADLLSGLFHWWQDRWPSVTLLWLGSYLIYHSRLHHDDPSKFGDNGFWYRNYTTFVGVLVIAALLLFLLGPSFFLLSLTCGGALTTQVHYLTHFPKRLNRLGRVLQRSGVFQSPGHHAKHHRHPNESHYCILTNFVNPFIDELQVWNRLEMVISYLGVKLSLGKN